MLYPSCVSIEKVEVQFNKQYNNVSRIGWSVAVGILSCIGGDCHFRSAEIATEMSKLCQHLDHFKLGMHIFAILCSLLPDLLAVSAAVFIHSTRTT